MARGENAATLSLGKPGNIHGMHTYLLQREDGEPDEVYSIASGLDYPSTGPEHSYLREISRAQYFTIDDQHALEAFFMLSRLEGIIPALESSHAVGHAIRLARNNAQSKPLSILVNLSGRGDKDLDYVIEHYGYGDEFLKGL